MVSMIQWLADQCNENPLAEKWLLSEDMRIAQQWKDRVNLAGYSTINLHSKTLSSIASSLVSCSLLEKRLQFAGQTTLQMMVRSLVCEYQAANRLKYFLRPGSIDGLTQLLARSIRDLRLSHLDPATMNATSFESPDKAADVLLVYRGYCDLLKQQGIVDYADCIEIAVTGIEDQSLKLPPDLLVLMPERGYYSPVELTLIQALGNNATVLHCELNDPYVDTDRKLADYIRSGLGTFRYSSGMGEANEIRAVFQNILSHSKGRRKQLDQVQILHTDYQQYVPLILDQLTGWLADQGDDSSLLPDYDRLPVTFAEGISCINTRPGRALRAWLRWQDEQFIQIRAVHIIREGILTRTEPAADIGYSKLSNTLRQLSIGFGADGYLPAIKKAIEDAERKILDQEAEESPDTGEMPENKYRRNFGLPALTAVLSMMQPMLDYAPKPQDTNSEILQKAKTFLTQCARADSKVDRAGRAKLLNEIEAMIDNVIASPDAELDALRWLKDLPTESRIMVSGPQPGCIHVAALSRGGHSGRTEIYVVGLDDGRYPKRAPVDPIVLDAERTRLSASLKTSANVTEEAGHALVRAICRVLADPNATVTLSYSMRDLVDDKLQFPSASMLELFRVTEDNDKAHVEDLQLYLGPPVAFVSQTVDDHLSKTDSLLAKLLTEPDRQENEEFLDEHFKYRPYQRLAIAAGKEATLTPYDGIIPNAGIDLSLTKTHVVSPSRLEMYGTCPRRFFFSYGLGVRAPDELVVDQEQWLDPLQFGSLVHHLFEEFLRELTVRDQTPVVKRDRELLLSHLQDKLQSLEKTIPAPNQDCYRRTTQKLRDTCQIFLEKEEAYCKAFNARPWVLEASIGMGGNPKSDLENPDPVPLELSDGRIIHVRGMLDRVDKLMTAGSETYAIWDYKSGSSYGFSKDSPFNQGRKLQPYLYLGMLRHRIKACGEDQDAVQSFGYFFPSPRTDGLRLQWTAAELQGGDDILMAISNLIADGVFVPTTNSADCTYCDYLSVCGDPNVVTETGVFKAMQPNTPVLEPWRMLREISNDSELQS